MHRKTLQTSKPSQSKKNSQSIPPNRLQKSQIDLAAVVKIQNWWKKTYQNIVIFTQLYHKSRVFQVKLKRDRGIPSYEPEKYSSYQSKIPFEFEESFSEKPMLKENYLASSEESFQNATLNSSIQSKTADLMHFLDQSEVQVKPKKEITMAYNSQATLLNYRLELDEAMKTIDSLKLVIQRFKKEAVIRDEENKKNLEEALGKQRNEYEEIGMKNLQFIEELLAEKQLRIHQLGELTGKLKEMEGKHQKTVQDLKEQAQKELKKQKDSWVTSENNKRNTWVKEKTKEIKENTTKNLEPEIMRIIAENKRQIEKIKEEQQNELKMRKLENDQVFEKKLQDYKEEMKLRYDEMLEKEREDYQGRLRDLHFKQEEELLNMRKRWNEDMGGERQKIQELRQRDENNFQNKLRMIEEEYTAKIEEITGKHAGFISELEKKHENKYKKLKQEFMIEKEEWVQSQLSKLTKDFEEKKESVKADLVQNRDKELKLVISKLSEEKVSYKKKLEKECEIKLKMQKENHDIEVSDYEKLIENLKEKIEKTNSARKNLDENFQMLGKRIQEQEMVVLRLEGEKLHLKDVITSLEIKIENYKEGQGEVIEEVRKEEKRKQMQVQSELEITKEQINLLKEKYEEKLSQITQKEAEEFEAIETRVKSTIMKKDEKIREVQEELHLARLKTSKLEELLEKQRKTLTYL